MEERYKYTIQLSENESRNGPRNVQHEEGKVILRNRMRRIAQVC